MGAAAGLCVGLSILEVDTFAFSLDEDIESVSVNAAEATEPWELGQECTYVYRPPDPDAEAAVVRWKSTKTI